MSAARVATALCAAALAMATVAGCAGERATPAVSSVAATPSPGPRVEATAVRTVDGDTIIVDLDGRTRRVRLMGVDTPETVKPNVAVQCFGPQAHDFTAARVPAGTRVGLEYDPVAGRVDRYGRTLAYVWLPDGTMLDQELIAEGYGREYDYAEQNYRYRPQFRQAEAQARAAGKGLWSACPH